MSLYLTLPTVTPCPPGHNLSTNTVPRHALASLSLLGLSSLTAQGALLDSTHSTSLKTTTTSASVRPLTTTFSITDGARTALQELQTIHIRTQNPSSCMPPEQTSAMRARLGTRISVLAQHLLSAISTVDSTTLTHQFLTHSKLVSA